MTNIVRPFWRSFTREYSNVLISRIALDRLKTKQGTMLIKTFGVVVCTNMMQTVIGRLLQGELVNLKSTDS